MQQAITGFARGPAALIALWLLFLVPRVLVLLLDVVPTSDADWYFTRAVLLARGEGYLSSEGLPTAYWPVGWPMMMSLAMRALGENVLAVGLINLVAAALSAWLLLDLGRRIFGGELAGRIALLLYAIYPNAIGYVPLALTEVFYTALLLAICWLLVARQGWAAGIAAGLLLGLASLVKAQTLVVLPLILGIGLLRQSADWRDLLRRLPRTLGLFAAILAVAAAAIAPWSLRNQRELGQLVAVSTNGGITLLTGNNPTAIGSYSEADPLVQTLYARKLPELERDAEAKRLGMAWIAANPARFAALMPQKAFRLWGADGEAQWAYETGWAAYADHAGAMRALRLANQAYYFGLLALFLIAGGIMLKRRLGAGEPVFDWWLLPYGIAAYPTAIAVVFSGQSRFHYPVMPFVCMAAAWLLADWLTRKTRHA